MGVQHQQFATGQGDAVTGRLGFGLDRFRTVLGAVVHRQGGDHAALGDRRQPLLLLLGAAAGGQGGGAQHRGGQERGHRQVTADLTGHQAGAHQAEADAAVLLGHQDAGQAGLHHGVPQRLVVALLVVTVAQFAQVGYRALVGHQPRHGILQHLLFVVKFHQRRLLMRPAGPAGVWKQSPASPRRCRLRWNCPWNGATRGRTDRPWCARFPTPGLRRRGRPSSLRSGAC